MAFFPSYRMMQDVAAVFEERCEESTLPVKMLLQTNHMNEAQREEFLAQFEEQTDDSLLAFCVMGGIFGEGIDLKEDRLIGAIVVGTGLPQVSNEQEILKNYYDSNDESGFDYAYRYPGLNKVLQAAGRVIRTTSDRGIMILLDRRFLSHEYKGLFPIEWEHARTVNCEQISEVVRKFWQND